MPNALKQMEYGQSFELMREYFSSISFKQETYYKPKLAWINFNMFGDFLQHVDLRFSDMTDQQVDALAFKS